MRDDIIDIKDEDPFGNDPFERRVIAENFMKIFKANDEGVVLSIDSDWGTGKTTFIKMWESLINNDDRYKDSYCSIYFNAWEYDYLEDPLLAILTEIKVREKNEQGQVNLAPEIFKEIFDPIYLFAKKGIDIALKLSTSGSIGVDDLKIKEDDTQEQILEQMNKISNEVLNRCTNARRLREEFKEKLSDFSKNHDKKLIFFIDELDRCRPSFAIELLETIKHLFSVSGVIFVVSLDKKQLSHSIGTVYGNGMDTDGYLRRFFDIDYKLPIADRSTYMNIKNKKTFNGYKNVEYLEYFLEGFVIYYKFSLRDIDKLHNYIKILIPLIKEFKSESYDLSHITTISYLYAYLIAIKFKRPNFYNKIIEVDYYYNMDQHEDLLGLDKIAEIKFVPNNRLNKSDIQTIKKGVIRNYLRLNYWNHFNSNEISIDDENEFKIELDVGGQFDMRRLFNHKGKCSINLNMEFMNSLNL